MATELEDPLVQLLTVQVAVYVPEPTPVNGFELEPLDHAIVPLQPVAVKSAGEVFELVLMEGGLGDVQPPPLQPAGRGSFSSKQLSSAVVKRPVPVSHDLDLKSPELFLA